MNDLISEARTYLARDAAAPEQARGPHQTTGVELAVRLRRQAIDLSCHKGTEFSPDILTLHLLAAKVALIAHGAASPELEVYERDIFYYRNFAPSHPTVAEYNAFKLGFR